MVYPRVGIVTTLINADKVIESFVKYHHKIGFDHIYLFFDDPYDKSIAKVNGIKGVTVLVNDRSLQKAWKNTKLYAVKHEYHRYIDVEAMSRQMLNMAVACEMAVHDKVDWLLHIDIDELFYLPGESVKDHFATLARNNIASFHYSNYEGIPEKFEIGDFFKEVTLFKRNPLHYSYRIERLIRTHYRSDFFNYYKVGKMAAQVNKIDIPLLHEVITKKDSKKLRTYCYEQKQKAAYFLKRCFTSKSVQFPVILHYPICGFNHFIDKYKTLGKFEDKWFGERDVIPFHKRSRDIVGTGDMQLAGVFFRENVMMEKAILDELLNKRILLRLEEPMKVINSQS